MPYSEPQSTVAVTDALAGRADPISEAPNPGGGFSGLLRLVGTRPWTLGGACVSGVLSSACGLVPYLAVFWIAQTVFAPNAGAQADATGEVWRYALLGVAASALKFVFGSISHSLAHAGAFGILYDLRIRIARKLGRVPLGFFQKHSPGSLQKAMVDDVGRLEGFLAHMLPDAAAAFTVPFLALGLMFSIDWRLTLAALIALPMAIVVQFSMYSKSGKQAYEDYHESTDATKRAVLEFLRGIHVVKAFGLEARTFGRLQAAVDQMTNYVDDYARKSAPPFIVAMKLLGGGTSALFIVPVGVWLYLQPNGGVDAATLLFFLIVGTQVLTPFLRIANVQGNLMLLMRGADHLQEILDAPELEPGGQPLPVGTELRFENVSFTYEDGGAASSAESPVPSSDPALPTSARGPALMDLNCTIPSGKTTAIIGASGSGKSTMLRLIARFWDVQSGAVRMDGADIRTLDLDAYMRRISIVFQDVFLFRGSIADNLRIARPEASAAELEAACRAARIHEVIERMPAGYETQLGERGTRLSGGEKQRLSIARALLKDAPILLLDEATAFADAENESLIHEALRTIQKGRTMVVVAHRLDTIRGADQILVLDRGRLVDSGDHTQLSERCTTYQELWRNYASAVEWGFRRENEEALS